MLPTYNILTKFFKYFILEDYFLNHHLESHIKDYALVLQKVDVELYPGHWGKKDSLHYLFSIVLYTESLNSGASDLKKSFEVELDTWSHKTVLAVCLLHHHQCSSQK